MTKILDSAKLYGNNVLNFIFAKVKVAKYNNDVLLILFTVILTQ